MTVLLENRSEAEAQTPAAPRVPRGVGAPRTGLQRLVTATCRAPAQRVPPPPTVRGRGGGPPPHGGGGDAGGARAGGPPPRAPATRAAARGRSRAAGSGSSPRR